jgi:hypothetical protein
MRDVAGLYLLNCEDGYPLHGIMRRSPVDERNRTARSDPPACGWR